jgi:hypothetical protein
VSASQQPDPGPSAHPSSDQPPSTLPRAKLAARFLWGGAVLLLTAGAFTAASCAAPPPEPTLSPEVRLAMPVVPPNPSEADLGRLLYWYHCMPCHGDRGQGLTDEWRSAWVEDHQNCWARGCHAGRPGDEGFPIPHDVPAVIGSPEALASFDDIAGLAAYLHQAHPPQRPGALGAEDCQALAVFLFQANGREAPPASPVAQSTSWSLATLAVCALVLAGLRIASRGPARDGQESSPDAGSGHG